jgi:DNA polymerase-4
MNENRKIIHIDMDAFFASVEMASNPNLRGKPIIVCGNPEGRTAVASASYEARKFGVKAGMGLPEALRLCPNAILVEGSPQKYITTSIKILKILSEYSDLLELFSVDEAFLDVTHTEHLFGGARKIAEEAKERVKSRFDITCSAGIAPNKILAKLASGFSKPDGLSIIVPEDIPRVLEDMEVEAICGIGEKTKIILNKMGIRTCGDLSRFDVKKLEKVFGKGGRVLHEMSLGIDDSPVRPYYKESVTKSFGHTMTLEEDTNDVSLILRHIFQLSEQVGRRMRKEKYTGRTVTLILRYEDFETHSHQKTLDLSLDQGFEIYKAARSILSRVYDGKRLLRLLGVSVSNLSKGEKQSDLFLKGREDTLRKAIDDLNDRFGEFSVTRASLLHASGKHNIVPFGSVKGKELGK